MSSQAFKIEDIFGVKGQIVVVTGGGTGIGKGEILSTVYAPIFRGMIANYLSWEAITAGFANNGAKVYITGRRKEVLDAAAKEIGGQVVAYILLSKTPRPRYPQKEEEIQGDVSTKQGCKAIGDAIAVKESKIDVLINCAGVMAPWRSSVTNHDDPDQVAGLLWDGHEDDDFNYSNSSEKEIFNIREKLFFADIHSRLTPSVYFVTAALVPLLRKSDYPSVTVIASIAGLANQRAMGTVSYGVTKRRILISSTAIHLGKLLAGRLHPLKIRVNTICPGIFPSEMTGKSNNGQGHEYNLAEGAAKAAKRSTVGRPGLPEEIVGPVLLLASKAGGYMDGALLTVDGGRLMGAGINDGLRLPEDTYI
uniref:Short-chain dehydrogenase n=1 Tax=Kwoniella dejecticola CBS 10117 TaxID=1296121 RepID=A0A1A6ACE2_9TREE|nr:uncharacterized protein I303_01953 [Kwoniella dejecticola CBS 10117]OBR87741.1 hypothetical protein I303_01953 [Kwoniella dejecticola CBS 10117]